MNGQDKCPHCGASRSRVLFDGDVSEYYDCESFDVKDDPNTGVHQSARCSLSVERAAHAATKRELEKCKAENKRWQSIASGQIQSTSDELKRLATAEARVRELESLLCGQERPEGDDGEWVEVLIPWNRIGGDMGDLPFTLGDAMPRKEEK